MYNLISKINSMIPRLLINFKNYRNATGENAFKLGKIIEKVSISSGVGIGVCVNPLELKYLAENLKIPVFLQHSDFDSFGAHSGSVLPELAKFYGASGVLLNHIEKPLSFGFIEESLKICKKIGLDTLVCAESIKEAKRVFALSPSMILLEHCDYMGSCVSIIEHAPELIEEASRLFGRDSFMIGAGISTVKHIEIALSRGAYGVIVANAVVNAKDPEMKLLELLEGFKLG